MCDTQPACGESPDSKAVLFRKYAEELGLDLSRFDDDLKSTAVAARVQRDVEDGRALGVRGTPTFFLNSKRLIPSTTEEFPRAIDDALAH